MAIKPIFEKLDDPSIEEEIKTSIQKKLEAKSSDGKILISGHVNAIKGIVWIFGKIHVKLEKKNWTVFDWIRVIE